MSLVPTNGTFSINLNFYQALPENYKDRSHGRTLVNVEGLFGHRETMLLSSIKVSLRILRGIVALKCSFH